VKSSNTPTYSSALPSTSPSPCWVPNLSPPPSLPLLSLSPPVPSSAVPLFFRPVSLPSTLSFLSSDLLSLLLSLFSSPFLLQISFPPPLSLYFTLSFPSSNLLFFLYSFLPLSLPSSSLLSSSSPFLPCSPFPLRLSFPPILYLPSTLSFSSYSLCPRKIL
jgi:hypothetical protein